MGTLHCHCHCYEEPLVSHGLEEYICPFWYNESIQCLVINYLQVYMFSLSCIKCLFQKAT